MRHCKIREELAIKISSFGIYEYNAKHDLNLSTARLIAQMVWYFIEGFNFRVKDYPFSTKGRLSKIYSFIR